MERKSPRPFYMLAIPSPPPLPRTSQQDGETERESAREKERQREREKEEERRNALAVWPHNIHTQSKRKTSINITIISSRNRVEYKDEPFGECVYRSICVEPPVTHSAPYNKHTNFIIGKLFSPLYVQ